MCLRQPAQRQSVLRPYGLAVLPLQGLVMTGQGFGVPVDALVPLLPGGMLDAQDGQGLGDVPFPQARTPLAQGLVDLHALRGPGHRIVDASARTELPRQTAQRERPQALDLVRPVPVVLLGLRQPFDQLARLGRRLQGLALTADAVGGRGQRAQGLHQTEGVPAAGVALEQRFQTPYGVPGTQVRVLEPPHVDEPVGQVLESLRQGELVLLGRTELVQGVVHVHRLPGDLVRLDAQPRTGQVQRPALKGPGQLSPVVLNGRCAALAVVLHRVFRDGRGELQQDVRAGEVEFPEDLGGDLLRGLLAERGVQRAGQRGADGARELVLIGGRDLFDQPDEGAGVTAQRGVQRLAGPLLGRRLTRPVGPAAVGAAW